MSTHLNANANVSLDANANANVIFRNTFKCKCFSYTFANAFELISNVLALTFCFFYLEKKQRNVYKHIINLIQ